MRKARMLCVMLSLLVLYLVPSQISSAEAFLPQGSHVVFSENGKYGLQDADGAVVIPAEFDGLQPIQGNYCIVQRDGREGLWSIHGDVILDCAFNELFIYGNMCIVYETITDGFLFDLTNRKPASDHYSYLYPIAGGKAYKASSPVESPEEYYCLLDEKGGLLFDHCQVIEPAYNGTNGTWLIVTEDDVESYISIASSESELPSYLTIHQAGQWWIETLEHTRITPIYERIAWENGAGLFAYLEDEKWFIAPLVGPESATPIAGPFECEGEPSYIGDGNFAFKQQGGYRIWSYNLKKSAFLDGADQIGRFQHGGAIYTADGSNGYIFIDLTFTPPLFEDSTVFIGEFAMVRQNGVWHPIDHKGEVHQGVSFAEVYDSLLGELEIDYFMIVQDDWSYLCFDADLNPITVRTLAGFG